MTAKSSRSRVDNRRRTIDGEPPAQKPQRSLRVGLRALLTRAKSASAPSPAWPKTIGGADGMLLAVLVALVAFGVVMVYSASAVLAYRHFDDGQHYLVRQGIFALAGVPVMVVLARIDYHRLRPLTYPIMVGTVALLAATSMIGKTAGGAARWLKLGPVHVQPAEMVKVAMIFWLAYSLSRKSESIRTFSIGFLPHVLVAALLMGLCLMQPDFGSAVMIGLLTTVLLFTAGARLGYLLGGTGIALFGAYLAVSGSEYRMRRILAYLDPIAHRQTSGYQVAESLMSFGAGGVTGVGIGDSRQKLFFLPEAHTDFISAIVAEELGLIGLCLLVLAYVVIVHRGIVAAFRAPDDYGTYLAVGLASFVGLQAFTNLAVAVGLLPTKGLVLPFMSYGGSSLLVNCAAMGVLLNVSRPREGGVMPAEKESRGKPGKLRNNARFAARGEERSMAGGVA
jgi:cell division protein FtsW